MALTSLPNLNVGLNIGILFTFPVKSIRSPGDISIWPDPTSSIAIDGASSLRRSTEER